MPIAEARSLVAPPNRAPLPYGLLSVAQSVPDGDAHWENGTRWQPVPCGSAGVTIDPCPTPPDDKVATQDGIPEYGAEAFVVYSWVNCLVDDPEKYAEDMLLNGEERAVERVFWTGSAAATGAGPVDINPHLAEDTAIDQVIFGRSENVQSAATVVTTAATDIVEAMGLLESALAWCYGNRGVIHVPRSLGPALRHSNLVKSQGNQLSTDPNGNLVALGAGYPGTGPNAALTAGSQWIYATGAVVMRRSTIRNTGPFNQAFDRAKNDSYMISERTYSLAWECCHFAAQVSAGGITAGAAGSAS